MTDVSQPTPYPEVNAILQELLRSVQRTLGHHLIGMYLDGSLTSRDFDQASDIDFVVVTDAPISDPLFLALQAMHDRIATMDSPYAIELEGSYLSQQALRRYDPACALHPNIERGAGERLKIVEHDAVWNTHRSILRDRGMTLVGPAPQTLIDPVSPNDLRRAMLGTVHGWATHIFDAPAQLNRRGYQSYVVLTLCRILYTLHYGSVASKPIAAHWAQETLGERWLLLIERALTGRHNADSEASAEDRTGTLELILALRERVQQFELPPDDA